MKLFITVLLAFILVIDPTKVSKINSLKSEAKKAYLAGDMKTAVEKYTELKTLGVNEPEIEINLANAYFQRNDTTNAFNTYQPLASNADAKLNSWANLQMGVIANRQGKFEEALNYFKQAIKADANNDQARYNYEMVKKKLDEKKKQDQNNKDQNKDKKDDKKNQKDKNDQQKKDQKDKQDKDKKEQQNKDQKDKQDQQKKEQEKKEQEKKDQQKKDQQNKDQKDKDQKDKQEQQKKEQNDKQGKSGQKENQKDQPKDEQKNQPSLSDKLKEMKISEQKAKMILEAMKNQEVQYLQQNKRKATQPRNKDKPDW